MTTSYDFDGAVAAGVISAETAAALKAHFDAGNAPMVDEEQFRLVTSFNDIFVSIAAILFLTGCAWAGGSVAPALGAALLTAAAWGMAEFFTAKRRMALPSILLLIAFVGGLFATALTVLVPDGHVEDSDQTGMALAALASAIAAGGAWLHWRRFHVPITVAAGVAALTGMIFGLLAAALPNVQLQGLLPIMLVAGLAIFGLAMRWDMADRARHTRKADVAFWLHLLAAPLIVHPVFALLGLTDGAASPALAGLVILIYFVLGAIALVIDRRALMVSALAYVLAAMGALFEQFGAVSLSVAITALIIGSALLLLSAFWHNARAALLLRLPDQLQARLPAL